MCSLETSDGTLNHGEGELKDVGSEYPALIIRGSYTYTDEKTGQTFTVNYIADENGYRPVGDHIPQLPEPVLN